MPEPEVQNRRSRTRLAWGSVVIALTLGVVLFFPDVVSLVWHLRHGSQASFHGVTALVPSGWWAFEGDGSLIIQKMGNDLLGKSQSQEVILQPLEVPAGAIPGDERWRDSQIAEQSKRGYAFVSERIVSVGGEQGYCYYFKDLRDTNNLLATCDVPSLRLYVDFLGGPSDAVVLERILSTMGRDR